MTTHKVVEEMKEGARREAALVVREAELDGGEDSRGGASPGGDDARRGGGAQAHAAASSTESLRSTVEMYRRLLDQEEAIAADEEGAKA